MPQPPVSDAIDGERIAQDAALWAAREGGAHPNLGLAFGAFVSRLRLARLPVDRFFAITPLLHPEWLGVRHLWVEGGRGVETRWLPHGVVSTEFFRNSPLEAVKPGGEILRYRLSQNDCAAARTYPILGELREAGFTDYAMTAVSDGGPLAQYLAWGTRKPGGFSDQDILTLDALGPIVRIMSRLYGEKIEARALLDAYIGARSAERVRSGEIRRGHAQRIEAILWFSDLRGFTALSEREPPERVLSLLNAYFEAQCTPIVSMGGEILKFMGDGLLAVFPIERAADGPEVALAALSAVEQAVAHVRLLSRRRQRSGESAIDFGVALHLGEAHYGNIGAQNRLDFTVIGRAVNQAARIEGLCGKLDRRFLASAAFAGICPTPLEDLGSYPVKGVAEEIRVFGFKTARPPQAHLESEQRKSIS